ncbi:MAG: Stealth CR1 domain-containing protein, partial [Bacteroidales bacterium]|nr:Stealth CR1 domain-containing protein [Bacteroidales bacterium]
MPHKKVVTIAGKLLMATSNDISGPIDAVIAWVDGSDPVLTEKRNRYLGGPAVSSPRSAHPSRFASVNEIRYCVLSILKYAPFVRNLYIVTDRQDPDLYAEINRYFPERAGSLKIVDHTEIFEGFEEYLPTFNSISIGNMVWRIKGLSENFVYFNDDVFLIRPVDPVDWVRDGRPVIRARWRIPPFIRIFRNGIRKAFNRYVLSNPDWQPKFSYYLVQWNAARLAGFRFRFLFNCHTPHVMNRRTLADFYSDRPDLLRTNISYRFRSQTQFNVTTLANHLEYGSGNRNVAGLNLGYLVPSYYTRRKLNRKILRCENDARVKSVCIQSLDMVSVEEQTRMLDWVEAMLRPGERPGSDARPIDVVVAWVDGNDPGLAEKRQSYLSGGAAATHPGADPARFASVNEIRYCVLSILRFAPFVRNIYIVTDGQDPGLHEEIAARFPGRESTVRIVDHTEIFRGYGQYLPTFNSISIANMIWRIDGISDNFVYFNDDIFLIRPVSREDWFAGSRPVLRGRWVPAPLFRIAWSHLSRLYNKYFIRNMDFAPRASFHMGQWRSASLLGFKWRYFATSHTPHAVGRQMVSDFFGRRPDLLEENISYRFRSPSQFTFISLSNHLQLLDGSRHIAAPEVAYLQPQGRSHDYIESKINYCISNENIRFMCVQGLEMCSREEQQKLFGWLGG